MMMWHPGHGILKHSSIWHQPVSRYTDYGIIARNTCKPRPVQTCGANPSDGRQQHLPILEAVISAGNRRTTNLHVPGHKNGRGVLERFRQTIGSDPLKYDLTEIPGLDNLGAPSGIIGEAQVLAAEAFGADRTWFVVNGCSSAIHAAVMSCAGPGDTLLVARNCHLSVFSAMVMSGCQPLWLAPELDARYGIAHCILPETLRRAFVFAQASGMRVKGVMIVSPTYFGVVAPIRDLAQVCHDHGVPLLVDEAHGAHFGTHPSLPSGALAEGADCVMHSTHKVLSAMTQAAMLHLQGTRLSPDRISKCLQIVQTSSPSYILLASLDTARAILKEPGFMQEPIAAAKLARELLSDVIGLEILSEGTFDPSLSSGGKGHFQVDPLRLTLRVTGLGLTGFEAAALLDHHGVIPELATAQTIVCVFGPGSSILDAKALVSALEAIQSGCPPQPSVQTDPVDDEAATLLPPDISARSEMQGPALPAMLPREAFFSETTRIPLADSVGHVSTELLCPYPPGVPVLFPGEVVTREAVLQVYRALSAGGTVTGASDTSLGTILVISNNKGT